jgi:hypothetical protein
MAFGSWWRNRCAAYEGANQESRNAGIIVEAFDSLAPAKLALLASRLCRWRPRRSTVPNASHLAETPYSFRCGLADYS